MFRLNSDRVKKMSSDEDDVTELVDASGGGGKGASSGGGKGPMATSSVVSAKRVPPPKIGLKSKPDEVATYLAWFAKHGSSRSSVELEWTREAMGALMPFVVELGDNHELRVCVLCHKAFNPPLVMLRT